MFMLLLLMLLVALVLSTDVHLPLPSFSFDLSRIIGIGRERFYQMDGITKAFDDLAAVPMAMKEILLDGIDNFASAFKQSKETGGGDSDGDKDSYDLQMSMNLYENDTLIRTAHNEDDRKERYSKMTHEYAMMHYMLCSLYSVDQDRYKNVFRIVLGRDPRVDPTARKSKNTASPDTQEQTDKIDQEKKEAPEA